MEEFRKKYPPKERIPGGAYGNIYVTEDDKYIIKQQSLNFKLSVNNSDAALKEITFMLQYKHPNICPVVDYYLDSETKSLLIVLPKGIPLCKVWQDKLMTNIEILTDLTAGLAFMSGYGIAHRDMNVFNCVALPSEEGYKIVLIDFNLVEYCDLYEDNFYFKGLNHRENNIYVDPENNKDTKNSIIKEVYSVGKMVEVLYEEVHEEVPVLVKEYLVPTGSRKNIFELLEDPSLVKSRILDIDYQNLYNLEGDKIKINHLRTEKVLKLIKKLLSLSVYIKLDLRILFNTLHMYFHYLYLEQENQDLDLITCFMISTCIVSEIGINLETIQRFAKLLKINQPSYEECVKSMHKIIKTLKNKFFYRTIFQRCQNSHQLIEEIDRILYEPDYVLGEIYETDFPEPGCIFKDTFYKYYLSHDYTSVNMNISEDRNIYKAKFM